MKKITIIIFILLSLTGCTKDEPKPNPECIKIDCKALVAYYPQNGDVADRYIAQLQYINCCGKEPLMITPK